MGLAPNESIDCSLFKRPHRLLACTENLQNMEVCKTTTSSTKTPVELKNITLMYETCKVQHLEVQYHSLFLIHLESVEFNVVQELCLDQL